MTNTAIDFRREASEALAEAEADLDKANVGGLTPLIGAAFKGHTAVVEWLLGREADWAATM